MNTAPLFAVLRSSMPLAIAEDPHRLAVEACEIGLPPGVWPQQIATDLGNGQPFSLLSSAADGSRLYGQCGGPLHLRVFVEV